VRSLGVDAVSRQSESEPLARAAALGRAAHGLLPTLRALALGSNYLAPQHAVAVGGGLCKSDGENEKEQQDAGSESYG
jgi:hypothetical protein